MATHGSNVWFDLMTSEPAAAKSFYGDVIGWPTIPFEEGDPNAPYDMWTVGDVPVGGVAALPEDAVEMGAPPHWMAYTHVDDVDATAAKAEQLGGSVLKAAWDIPQVGRLAVLADPQGAVFAIYKSSGEQTPTPDENAAGVFSWSELNTTDYESAWKFYSELVNWKERGQTEMAPGQTYFMFNDAIEQTKGGMSNFANQMKVPPHWLYYITVDDIDAACARVTAAGGKVRGGPMEIPGNDKIAQCMDPQGAAFAIYCAGNKG